MVLVSEEKMKALNLRPLFKIVAYGDAEKAPVDFTTAPADAVPKALKMANMDVKDIDYP